MPMRRRLLVVLTASASVTAIAATALVAGSASADPTAGGFPQVRVFNGSNATNANAPNPSPSPTPKPTPTPTSRPGGSLPGDFNGDGSSDPSDFTKVGTGQLIFPNSNQSAPAPSPSPTPKPKPTPTPTSRPGGSLPGDFNGDGSTDPSDFN